MGDIHESIPAQPRELWSIALKHDLSVLDVKTIEAELEIPFYELGDTDKSALGGRVLAASDEYDTDVTYWQLSRRRNKANTRWIQGVELKLLTTIASDDGSEWEAEREKAAKVFETLRQAPPSE